MEKQIFNFTDYKVDVEIAGHDFKLDCSTKTGDRIKKSANELRELSDAIKNGEKTEMDAIVYGHEFVDELLGNGASKVIFEGREQRIDDFADLFMWIYDIVSAYADERKKAVGNRAERRAKSKKHG